MDNSSSRENEPSSCIAIAETGADRRLITALPERTSRYEISIRWSDARLKAPRGNDGLRTCCYAPCWTKLTEIVERHGGRRNGALIAEASPLHQSVTASTEFRCVSLMRA